jgi:hypothetical protein
MFCSDCGKRMLRGACPGCGKTISHEARFQGGRVASNWNAFLGQRKPTQTEMDEMDRYGVPYDVDPEIRRPIIELNRRGFHTHGSCAGHDFPSLNVRGRGYITINRGLAGHYVREPWNLPVHEQEQVKRCSVITGLKESR